jgi:hypothetical protein
VDLFAGPAKLERMFADFDCAILQSRDNLAEVELSAIFARYVVQAALPLYLIREVLRISKIVSTNIRDGF